MHEPQWIQEPLVPLTMIGLAFFFLYWAMRKKQEHKPKGSYNLEKGIAGHKIFETGDRWVLFTLFIGLSAFAAHILAEYTFHIYDITPIDRFTHGLSGMAITAFILNFNLTRGRKVYYPTSIAVSWLAFILWELYEWMSVRVTISPWGIGIDLWIDTLGALAICFIYDEFMGRD